MAWLGEELPEKEQDGRTPFSPRCVKDVVEERLFAHRRDLLTRLDLVFMDTTSLYFEGAGGQTLGRHGIERHRPDLRQMILAVLIDGAGRPVCSEMWPGNTADVTTLIPVIDRLRRRFDIARVCVVADRGMISAETVAELEARRLLYILGVRERTDKLVRQLVLDDPAPFVPLAVKKRGKEIDYQAKTVTLAGRRYIVCRNHQEAEKDAADRAAIVAALERQLAKGDKALVSNTGFRRYLKTISDEHFAIDPDKIEEEKRCRRSALIPSPSVGMISPFSTRTTSSLRKAVADTCSISPEVRMRLAINSVLVRRSEAAFALPRPSASASATFANHTVNSRMAVTTPLYAADALEGPNRPGLIVSAAVTSAPSQTTNITGLRICDRGSSFLTASITDCSHNSAP